jgi:transposase
MCDQVQVLLHALFEQYHAHTEASLPKTRALARELLLAWDTFWGVLDDPMCLLTNNEAERAPRHWVIAQHISLGTRTEQGSRVFPLLVSVIETCRKRSVSP